MEREVKIGIVILIISLFLLGIVYFINETNILGFLNKPITSGEGLGPLCPSLSKCQDFCLTNRGRCNSYCQANPTNKICDLLT